MRVRRAEPEQGQQWRAVAWQAAGGPPRIVEVTGVFGDGKYVTVKRIDGTGPDTRRILAESLIAKYELLKAEDPGGS